MLILIADDDRITRRLLERAVTQLGNRCIAAEDGEQAWELFQEHNPEVVISDWMMPRLDGIDLCRRIRDNPGSGYPYFILLTSLTAKEDALLGMQAGADDYLRKPLDVDELNLRLIAARRVTALHRKLTEQKIALEELNQEFYQDGRIDPLTGIGNRRMMSEEMSQMHSQFRRYDRTYAVALFDIDFFKKYNDTCGHPAGDETLRSVAKAFTEESRAGDSVFRYGGEEFLALLPAQTLEGAEIAADRLRRAVEALEVPHPGKTPAGIVTVSSGVAVLSSGEDLSEDQLIERADQALYQAKQGGRNQVVCWKADESPEATEA